MLKLRTFLDFTKEEEWLNKLATNGYKFKSVWWIFYTFEKAESKNNTIRIDYRTFKDNSSFIDYITLFKDSGWDHICGSKLSGVQYFQSKIKDVSEEIFSDKSSKAGRYKRVFDSYLISALSFIPYTILFSTTYDLNIKQILNPKSLYLTPGLWEKTGSSFTTSFLFETPFAIMRFILLSIFPCVLLFSTVIAIKSYLIYRKERA